MKKEGLWYTKNEADLNVAIEQLIFSMRNQRKTPSSINTMQNDSAQSISLGKRRTIKQTCQ